MTARFSPAHTAIAKTIDEKVLSPVVSSALLPDTGMATEATGYFRQQVTSGSFGGTPFWNALASLAQGVANFFFSGLTNFDGLIADEISVDIKVRTPQGVRLLPNVPLHCNGTDSQNDAVKQALKDHKSIQVKITYDGGKPSECTPISWKIDSPSAQAVIASQDGGANGTSLPTQYNSTGGGDPITSPSSAGIPTALAAAINNSAKKYNIDPILLAALAKQESQYGAQLINGYGDRGNAVGVFQFDIHTSGRNAADLERMRTDIQYASDQAAQKLKGLLNDYNGDTEAALNVYNDGAKCAYRPDLTTQTPWGTEKVPYGQSVLRYYAQIQQSMPATLGQSFGDGTTDGRVANVATTKPAGQGNTKNAIVYRFQTDPSNALYQYTRDINAAGALVGVDPNMMAAAIMLRSGGKTRYVGGKGQMGLFGLSKDDFETYRKQLADIGFSSLVDDPLNPTSAIFTGALMLQNLIKQNNGYKGAIGALGLGQNESGYVAATGTSSPQAVLYYNKFKRLWLGIQTHSTELGSSPLDMRPEVQKQDLTWTSKQSGYTAATF